MSRTFSYITSKSHAINQIVHIENFSGDFSFPFFRFLEPSGRARGRA